MDFTGRSGPTLELLEHKCCCYEFEPSTTRRRAIRREIVHGFCAECFDFLDKLNLPKIPERRERFVFDFPRNNTKNPGFPSLDDNALVNLHTLCHIYTSSSDPKEIWTYGRILKRELKRHGFYFPSVLGAIAKESSRINPEDS